MEPTRFFERLCEQEKITIDEKEYRFSPPRRWKFDYCWPDIKLALEVEGGVWSRGRHVRPSGYENDCEKYSTAAIEGWCVIRVTTSMVANGMAIQLLKQALSVKKQ